MLRRRRSTVRVAGTPSNPWLTSCDPDATPTTTQPFESIGMTFSVRDRFICAEGTATGGARNSRPGNPTAATTESRDRVRPLPDCPAPTFSSIPKPSERALQAARIFVHACVAGRARFHSMNFNDSPLSSRRATDESSMTDVIGSGPSGWNTGLRNRLKHRPEFQPREERDSQVAESRHREPTALARSGDRLRVAPGEQTRIAGRTLEGGMVYVGAPLKSVRRWRECEPALIDPSLDVPPQAAGGGFPRMRVVNVDSTRP